MCLIEWIALNVPSRSRGTSYRSSRAYPPGMLHRLLGYAPTTWGEAVAVEEVPSEESGHNENRAWDRGGYP